MSDLNARPTLDDELPPLDDPETEDARDALTRDMPLYQAVSSPEWTMVAMHLAGLEQEAVELMIDSHGEEFIRWQARVKLLRELQELPATYGQRIREANERLDQEGTR